MVTFLDKLVSNYFELISGNFCLGGQFRMQPLKVSAGRTPEESGEGRNKDTLGPWEAGSLVKNNYKHRGGKVCGEECSAKFVAFVCFTESIFQGTGYLFSALSQGKELCLCPEVWKLPYIL